MDCTIKKLNDKSHVSIGAIIVAIIDHKNKEVTVSNDWCKCQGFKLQVGGEFNNAVPYEKLDVKKTMKCSHCGVTISSSMEEVMTSTFEERNFDGTPDNNTHDEDVVHLQRCPHCMGIIGDLGYIKDIDVLYEDLKSQTEE